jgi:ADP-ribosylglycohydrolase
MWAFQQLGDPARIALDGNGCGAAMRVAPVGVICRPDRIDQLVQGAYECSVPTHGGQLAICAAAAVAGAVSAALEGLPVKEVMDVTLHACKKAEALRPPAGRMSIAASLETIYSDISQSKRAAVHELAEKYFPDKPENIVPLAISLALFTESAEETILLAANLGGDSDSVASIGGAVAAALHPETVNAEWFEIVRLIEGYDVTEVAISLAGLRPGE